jgi:hypothetical protein
MIIVAQKETYQVKWKKAKRSNLFPAFLHHRSEASYLGLDRIPWNCIPSHYGCHLEIEERIVRSEDNGRQYSVTVGSGGGGFKAL